jgi:hypothetical protein
LLLGQPCLPPWTLSSCFDCPTGRLWSYTISQFTPKGVEVTDYAYAMGTGKIGALFDKIHDVGMPTSKVNYQWLAQIGFSSSNDRRLLGVLKQVGFTDSTQVPSDVWKKYRAASASERKRVLAQAIRDGYSDLYSFYSDAHSRSDSDIESFFRGHVNAGSQVLSKTIQTFKALTAIADFTGSAPSSQVAPTTSPADVAPPAEVPAHLPSVGRAAGKGTEMNVVINIQLAVPETKDAKVYDAFFESLKKHLLS